MSKVRAARLGALAVVLALGLAACGGDDSDSGANGDDTVEEVTTTTTPEEKDSSAAEVAAGLEHLVEEAKETAAAAGTDKAKAVELWDETHEIWEEIEGTIKDNSEDYYIRFEDALALLEGGAEDGDAAKASGAADEVAAIADDYLADYPA